MREQTLQDKLREIAESGDCPRAVNEKLITAVLQIDDLERQLVEAREDQADAKRYRWIVKDIDEKGCSKFDEFFYTSFESLSDYIDAEIQKVKPWTKMI